MAFIKDETTGLMEYVYDSLDDQLHKYDNDIRSNMPTIKVTEIHPRQDACQACHLVIATLYLHLNKDECIKLCDKCFKELVAAVRLYDIQEMNTRLSGLASVIKKTKGKRR